MKRVLTIDDSKVVRVMVARLLKPFNCQVLEAGDGEEGVKVAKQERPHLILLDVTMPVMDGRQTLEALRAAATTKAIPVIMLTAESRQDLVVAAAKLGVHGYLVKPFVPERFEEAVAAVLGPPEPVHKDLDATTVLVIDDSARLLDQARKILEPTWNVVTALSGAAGIERYSESRPAVVVIDVSMPDMDGFETMQAIKTEGGGGSYFVALTVRGDQAARTQALTAGFSGVVEKPFQGNTLADAVAIPSMSDGTGAVTIVDDCPMVNLPVFGGRAFGLFNAQETVRSLAENGHDRFVLDLTAHTELSIDVTKVIVTLLEGATTMGLRVAICAPQKLVADGLKGIREAATAIYADKLELARQRLDGAKTPVATA